MHRTRFLRLPFSFDVPRLRQDLAQIGQQEWINHINTAAYEKDWRCVPLRSVDGRSDHIAALPGMRYDDTSILARCAYFQEVINTFECDKTSVRLMAMGPGCRIKMHIDAATSLEDGMARLHVPIVTAPEVVFTVEDEDVHFSAGNTWYLNANCLHGVRNDSRSPRVHLMLDCVVNPWLESVFMEAGFVPDDKPKYGDSSITDANVADIIANLLAMDGDAGRQLATRLDEIRQSGQSA